MVIGFVGLGIMGKPMAKNLCRAGYTLIVNDHHKENVDELVQAGARSGDLKQIGMESDVVITMLPNSPQVKDVMLGENGIAGYMKKGTCFIDMSSINPVDSRYIGDVLKEKGIDMLDAPVSGGEPKAIDGTVAFMVGGDEKTFDKNKQILTHMGSTLSSIIIGTLAFITVDPASPPFIASNTHSGSTPAFFARMKLSETAWILHATII